MKRHYKILHCLRAPIGGLFRHVCDLAGQQTREGHEIGIVCDAVTGDALTDECLAEIGATCSLGVHRIKMSRQISFSDATAYKQILALAKNLAVDILHGHGAKGGAYARLAARSLKAASRPVRAFYTPHGGSLHFEPRSLKGRLFFTLERSLEPHTDGIIFESAYSRRVYAGKIGEPACRWRIIPNGLHAHELTPVEPNNGAADFVFVGELRYLKGVDVLLRAFAQLSETSSARLVIVGDGPDRGAFEDLAAQHGIAATTVFTGAMPARDAFRMGRCLVMPSRAESFPYVVLEAGAGGLPMLLTDVGGIPEITAETPVQLLKPGAVNPLAHAMQNFLEAPEILQATSEILRSEIAQRYTVEGMAKSIDQFYQVSTDSHDDESQHVSELIVH